MDSIFHDSMAIRVFGYPSAISGEKKLTEKEQTQAIKHVLNCKEERCQHAKESILLVLTRYFERIQRFRGVLSFASDKPRPLLEMLDEHQEKFEETILRNLGR